jgi:hypothetical protein
MLIRTLTLVTILTAPALAQAQHTMPPGMSHEEHLKQMGAAAMGFDQDKAAHHFRLRQDGGSIDVEARNPADAVTRQAIRAHLQDIAAAFGRGDFSKPFETHGEVPPGVKAMQRRKRFLQYRYEGLPAGGRVVISTADLKARDAVFEFLRYQIREHATGDPLTVPR